MFKPINAILKTTATVVAAVSAIAMIAPAASAATTDDPATKLQRGAVAYFEDRGANSAVRILTDPASTKYVDYIHIGDPKDATSISNMIQSLEFIKESNQLRAQEGLPALKVTDTMMAAAMADVDYANEHTEHPQQFNVGENLAWGYSDPFAGWYYEEKQNYEQNNGQPTGHYLNIISPDYVYTGFGVSQNGKQYGVTHGQVFLYDLGDTGSERVMDVDSYLADVKAWRLAQGGFTDVNADTPHYADITWLAGQGITTGYDDGTFGPNGTVNRQDMAAFLYRLAGSPDFTPDWSKNPFTDVSQGSDHAKEVMWLAANGISTGYKNPDGTAAFGGTAPVQRQDMAAFLQRLAEFQHAAVPSGEGKSFTDVNEQTPHADAIAWLSKTGVSDGYQDGSFGVGGTVLRQDMAAFLHRMKTNVLK